VIIGILAGSMLLVFGSATDSAKATRVVSELRSLKAAAMMYYADNAGWPTDISDLNDYMDRDPTEGEYCDYTVTSNDVLKTVSGDITGTWLKTDGLASADLFSIFYDGSNLTEKAKEAGVGVDTGDSEIGMILERD
jgi:general secretion pathway protein G